jgi:3-dehydroquinate synthase
MKPFVTIKQASATYPVFVDRGLLNRVGSLVTPRGRVFVITSEVLRGRFGEPVAASFAPRAEIINMPDGEAQKTIGTANGIVTELLERGAKRDSLAVVVGGGMVGDTAGFAASIFLRGIDLVHVPTTLLAQVDSSIGGKLAVNHPKGKNLIGSFFPPRAVVSDTSALDSLPSRELLSGLYEALKSGVIGDPSLFEIVEHRANVDLDAVVRKSIRVKAYIVASDEKEGDLRRLLNYGHTIGHAIEAALRYERLTHGEAVAWGMIAANAIAVRRAILPADVQRRIDDAIRDWKPSPLPPLNATGIVAATEHDKKNTGTNRVMIVPRAIGKCEVITDVTESEIRYGLEAIGIR